MSLYSDNMAGFAARVEQELPRFLPSTKTLQGTVAKAMAYAVSAGGKRIRPVLLMEFCRVAGGDPEAAIPFAVALEMIHSYSLVHDDLPCMDDSPLRRGKPSVHKAFGEDMALLAGDALLNRAFEVMLQPSEGSISADRRLRAAYILAEAAGIDGMVGGQTVDLESESRSLTMDELVALQDGKTAALLRAACVMGCVLAGADETQCHAAEVFGRELGLCFQIVDDILDVTSDADKLGKPVHSDEKHVKNTFVSLVGLDGASRLASEHTAAALGALAVFGDEAKGLAALCEALLHRDH